MPEYQAKYKGKTIVIKTQVRGAGPTARGAEDTTPESREQASDVEIQIDGRAIRVEAESAGGPYWSPHLPFVKFASPTDLAEAVVDRMTYE